MKKILLFLLLFSILAVCRTEAQSPATIVPYPEQIDIMEDELLLKNGYSVCVEEGLAPLAQLFIDDIYRLFQIKGKISSTKGSVVLARDKTMKGQQYRIESGKKQITVTGKNYEDISMGVTTLIQLSRKCGKTAGIPYVSITDGSAQDYRALSLDVARKPIDIETVKQCVELCRWYKLRYMQIHLTDDQQFTFPSKAFPKLATPGASYTLEELKDLVEYAKVRGITLIPEFDVPGHTRTLKRAYPEIFGRSSVLDMTNEKAREAVKTIMKEMMDVFYTSPYFHIGGDEAWIAPYARQEHVKEYILEKGYKDAMDIYLEFLVDLNGFIKGNGKQTIVWEGFPDKGSEKITIPNDILVIAWETMYQTPQSLLKNGYTIINASWQPCYVCPRSTRRWNPEHIYGWNIHRWEHFGKKAPAYNPIQFDGDVYIKGALMCSWEMNDAFQIASLHQRIPAFSEVAWRGKTQRSFEDFQSRYKETDRKFMQLIFPAVLKQEGFQKNDQLYDDDYEGKAATTGRVTLETSSLLPGTFVTYTEDGSKPTADSPRFTQLEIKEDKEIRFGIFTEEGKMIGYRNVFYRIQPSERQKNR